MEFPVNIKQSCKELDIIDLFNGKCQLCDSKDVITRSSYDRFIQEMGTPSEKITVLLKMRTFECKACNKQFSLEDLKYPNKMEYSKDILEYALTRYNYHNASGNEIARDLRILHQVDIPEDTVYSWLRLFSPDFIKSRLDKDPTDIPQNIDVLSIDGSYATIANDTIGKKKDVESLSVTKLENEQYLLMWWE